MASSAESLESAIQPEIASPATFADTDAETEVILKPSSEPFIDEEGTKFKILVAVSLAHLLNDTTQSLLVPSYPLLKDAFNLTFTQIGLITLTYQLTASMLQPLIGHFTDRHPLPYSLPFGMLFVLAGLLTLAFAPSYGWLIMGAMILGAGSSIFHPESSRVARLASGGKFGLAQSIFQVGGNAGSSFGPLLAAAVVISNGQRSLSWFCVLPICGFFLLLRVGKWASGRVKSTKHSGPLPAPLVPTKTLIRIFAALLVLIFSKYFYTASISSYFIFFLTHKFGISVEAAQVRLFFFLFAMAMGTLFGGPIGDRIGRKYVIWFSILGAAPFTLAMPYMNLFWTGIFVFLTGLIIGSAFPAIVVFAQELVPGRVGTVAGLFFGLSFGLGGIGAGVLGKMADAYGIETVYHICAFLPLLGMSAIFLPNIKEHKVV